MYDSTEELSAAGFGNIRGDDMNEGEKAIVREIAFEAVAVIKEELIKSIENHIELHQATCPAITATNRWPKQLWALILGVGIGSGGGVAMILKLFKVF